MTPLTVAQLQASLGKLQSGGTFTLGDTDLGIAAVQQLFDSSLPGDTLTLQKATANTANLSVTGLLTLDENNANLQTTAQFVTDAQQANVTGIVITAQVPGWTISTSFLTFDGTALQGVGFSALAVVLSARPDASGNTAPATGIGATVSFTGSSSSATSLPLVALLSSGTQDPYVLQAAFTPVPISAMSALAGGLPSALAGKASFDVIPSAVPIDTSVLALIGLSVTVSPSVTAAPVVMLSATVALDASWSLLPADPTFAPLTDIQATVGVAFPATNAQANAVVTGTLSLPGGVEVSAGFSIPDLSLLADLEQPFTLQPILQQYLPAAADDPLLATMQVTSGTATAVLSPLSFQLSLSLNDPITLATNVAFENIYLMLEGGTASGMGGSAYATFDVDGIDVQVGVGYAAGVWSFSGKATNAPTPPAGATNLPAGIAIGNLIASFSSSFGWTAPQALSSLVLTDLDFQADSGTRSFTFTADGTFALANANAAFTATVGLTYSSGAYSGNATGELTLVPTSNPSNQLIFDVSFQEGAGSTQISASWQDKGGAVSLTDLATALGFQAPDIPEGLDLDLTGVSFTYDADPSSQKLVLSATATQGSATFQSTGSGPTSRYTFTLDVSTDIDLSDLPLVGKALSKVETAQLDQIQVQIATATALTSASASLMLMLDLGGQQTPVTLSMGGTPTGGTGGGSGGQQVALAAAATSGAGSGTTDADGVTWFSVQQTFGPVTISQIGIKYSDSVLWALVSASMTAGGLTIALNGLSIGTPISSFSPQFNLEGLTVAYTDPPLEIGGSFLEVTPQSPVTLEFSGGVTFGTPELTITGYGSYAEVSGQPSLLLFAELAMALGGPPGFFVTGLAGGFGFNSALALPTLSQVPRFPMVAALPGTSSYQPGALGGSAGKPPTPLQALQALTTASPPWVTPSVGEYWGALGLTFTTYELVKSQALLVVEAGNALVVSLMGTGTAQFPQTGSQLYAWVQLELQVELAPAQGEFWLEAVLSANSFLISPSCLLSGGFAFAVWYGPSPHAGDFVLTMGGFNPGFDPPSYYPTVPRVGFHWQLDSTIDISGDAYAALTPSMLMAGGALDVTYQSGNLKAWFTAYADVLLRWNPFWFEVGIGVTVGASYAMHIFGAVKTITAELGATVALWGPSTGGTVTVKLIFSFTIDFGTPEDQAQGARQASWSDVVATLPNTSTTGGQNIVAVNAVSGVNPPPTPPASSGGGGQWSVRGATFAFTTSTSVPASSATAGATTIQGQLLNVGPIYVTGGTSLHQLGITDGGGQDVTSKFTITGVTGAASAALFGTSGGLSVPSGDGQLLSNQLVGLSCAANPPAQGNSAGAVSVQKYLSTDELDISGAVMPLSPGAQAQGDVPAASTTTVTVLTDPNSGIASSGAATARAAIFAALGTLGYGPGANDDLTQLASGAPDDLNAQPLLVVTS